MTEKTIRVTLNVKTIRALGQRAEDMGVSLSQLIEIKYKKMLD